MKFLNLVKTNSLLVDEEGKQTASFSLDGQVPEVVLHGLHDDGQGVLFDEVQDPHGPLHLLEDHCLRQVGQPGGVTTWGKTGIEVIGEQDAVTYKVSNSGWYLSTSQRLCKDETIQVILVSFNKSIGYSNNRSHTAATPQARSGLPLPRISSAAYNGRHFNTLPS